MHCKLVFTYSAVFQLFRHLSRLYLKIIKRLIKNGSYIPVVQRNKKRTELNTSI